MNIYKVKIYDGKEWYGADDKIKMYKKKYASFKPGVTVLVGCNGAGKSTLMQQIKESIEGKKDDSTLLLDYDNISDGQRTTMYKNMMMGNITELATQAQSSEGENIVINMNNLATKIGYYMYKYKEDPGYKKYVILLDAVDSGLSIDNMIYLKKFFNNIIEDSPEDKPVYIILSTNSFEFAYEMPCYDIMEGKYITFNDYNEYRDFIINTSKLKDIRYGKKPKEETDWKKQRDSGD